jgi:hypothetical protein
MSGLAVAGAVLPFLTLPIFILVLWAWAQLRDAGLPLPPHGGTVGAWVIVGFATASLAIGVVALVRIRHQPLRLRGQPYAEVGIGLSFLVGLFAVMAVPASNSARESPAEEVCLANVYHLARAMRAYMEDNDERLPLAQKWCDQLGAYVESPKSFVCPQAWRLRCGYAYNTCLSGRRSASVVVPENTVAIFESDRGWNAHGGAELLPKAPRHYHHGDVYGFADGRARWRSRRPAPSAQAGERPLWNLVATGEPPAKGATSE